ncbi:MAG: helix-turn-helix protein [Ferruginibacter sp.]|nr:helix-turn-helix protein [Ferruginibacter sp.]
MTLDQKIVTARRKKGMTQEELADKTNITVRTIQRLESGDSMPRAYTLKAIAIALEMDFESLSNSDEVPPDPASKQEQMLAPADPGHDLQMICLSCFSYLVVPFIHFLIPAFLVRKLNNPAALAFGRKVVRSQLIWVICTNLLMLANLIYNMIRARYYAKTLLISYLLPFFFMYVLNAAVILVYLFKAKSLARQIAANP